LQSFKALGFIKVYETFTRGKWVLSERGMLYHMMTSFVAEWPKNGPRDDAAVAPAIAAEPLVEQ
jgi:hypothetical protein